MLQVSHISHHSTTTHIITPNFHSPVAEINPIYDILEKDFRANYQFAKESTNSANKPSGAQAHGQVNWN